MELIDVLDEMFNGLIVNAKRENNYYSGYDTLVMKLGAGDELAFSLLLTGKIEGEEDSIGSLKYYSLNKDDYEADWKVEYNPKYVKKMKKGYFVSEMGRFQQFGSMCLKDILHGNRVKIVVEVCEETGEPTILWNKSKGGLQ